MTNFGTDSANWPQIELKDGEHVELEQGKPFDLTEEQLKQLFAGTLDPRQMQEERHADRRDASERRRGVSVLSDDGEVTYSRTPKKRLDFVWKVARNHREQD